MAKREGPEVTTRMSCFECKHVKSEDYACQGDSGHDVYCKHPDAPEKHYVGITWKTPEWCPCLKKAE